MRFLKIYMICHQDETSLFIEEQDSRLRIGDYEVTLWEGEIHNLFVYIYSDQYPNISELEGGYDISLRGSNSYHDLGEMYTFNNLLRESRFVYRTCIAVLILFISHGCYPSFKSDLPIGIPNE